MKEDSQILDYFNKIGSNKIILIVLVIVAIFFLTKIVRRFLDKLSERYIGKRILIKNFAPIISLTINLIGLFFIVFGVLKVSKDALLTFGISAGVAIGFAIQHLLANVFGGLVIIFTRPFNIGDKIEVGSYYGEVIDINLLKVKIVTPDDSIVNIPSKSFTESSTSNANSGELNCQVATTIYLPGSVDLQQIKEIAFEAVYSSPYAYLDKPIVVNFFDDFKEASLVRMKIKAYVYDHRYEFRFSSDIYERIKKYLGEKNLIPPDFYKYSS